MTAPSPQPTPRVPAVSAEAAAVRAEMARVRDRARVMRENNDARRTRLLERFPADLLPTPPPVRLPREGVTGQATSPHRASDLRTASLTRGDIAEHRPGPQRR